MELQWLDASHYSTAGSARQAVATGWSKADWAGRPGACDTILEDGFCVTFLVQDASNE